MASKTDALVAILCCFLAFSPCLQADRGSLPLQDTTRHSRNVDSPREGEDTPEITGGSVSVEAKLAGTNPEAPSVTGDDTSTDSSGKLSLSSSSDVKESVTKTSTAWNIKELTASDYDALITTAFSQPACILFSAQRRVASVPEKLFLQLWATSEVQKEFSSVFSVGKIYDATLMNVQSIASIPQARPSLCCYHGDVPNCFYGDHTPTRLRDWFYIQKNKVENLKSDIHAISVDRELHTNEVTVLGFARTEDQDGKLCKILSRLEKMFPAGVKALPLPKESPETKKVTQQFSVNTFPAALLVSKADPHQPFIRLTGHDLTLPTIELHIVVTLQKLAVKLTAQNFPPRVLEQKYPGPILVCFYSHREQGSLTYVKSFLHTAESVRRLGAAFRFGLVDLSEQRDILGKGWVDSTLVHQIPFTVLFSYEKVNKDSTSKMVTKQRLFRHSSPEPANVLTFLEDIGVPLKDHKGNQIAAHFDTPMCEMGAPFSPGVLNRMCVLWQNETGSTEVLGLQLAMDEETQGLGGKKRKVKKTGQILVLTSSTWDQVISSTHVTPTPYGQSGITSLAQAVAVMFVKANCSTCAKKMPELQHVHKAARGMKGVAVYIFNCSSDPGKCEEQGIKGFPTLVAYRVVPSKGVEDCTQDSGTDSIRLDYHGVLQAGKVLEWLSKVTESATSYGSKTGGSASQDVALFAEFADANEPDGFSFKCFQFLCERLYGQIACYVQSEKEANSNDVVSHITLHRSDGLKAPIYVAGEPLASVLESESEAQLHQFHSPHRYNLQPDTLCEDNAAFCADTLLSFIQDHARLPVMHITQQLFHTHQKQQLFNTHLPILIALGHADNFTQESPFFKNLYSAALTMYRSMSFATVVVDLYPMWAGQFVPVGYRREMLETTDAGSLHLNPPTLYTYPRLCIVQWHDHRHAAFYPSLGEKRWQRQHRSFTSCEIVKFAEDFLRDPDKLLTQTEIF